MRRVRLEGVYACMLWATESSDKFVIPAFHSFREDSQSAPSTHPDQPLGAMAQWKWPVRATRAVGIAEAINEAPRKLRSVAAITR